MRKLAFTISMIISFILSGIALPLRADDTVLFTANVAPDALIAFDLSRSMNRPPGGGYGYSNATDGSGNCSGDMVYYTPTGIYTTYCHNSDQANASGVMDKLYKYTNSEACTEPYYKSGSVDCSKLEIAKRAVFKLLDDDGDGTIEPEDSVSLNVRMGYMRYLGCDREDSELDYDAGCNTMQFDFPTTEDPAQFQYSQLYSKIGSESIPGTGYSRTPLAGQLKEAKQYLDDHKDADAAKECRKKFIILITDGNDTGACGMVAGGYTPPGYQTRKATLAAIKPAIDAGYQVFVVGFGADMPAKDVNTLEWCAFHGGTDNPTVDNEGDTSAIPPSALYEEPCTEFSGCVPDQLGCTNAPNDPGYQNLSGYAFLAEDATSLATSLQEIFSWINEKSFNFTAPTIPSMRLMTDEYAYISSMTPNATPFWKGYLKAYELDDNGILPVDEVTGFPTQDPIWDAQSKLGDTDPDSRTIYTVTLGGNRIEVPSLGGADVGFGPLLESRLVNLIKHIRGFDPYDINQDGNFNESREFKLGDIFHSQAVIVGAPSRFFVDQGYSGTGGFYDAKKNRLRVVIVGANDGMLHAFDAATGEEKWAFIPRSLLLKLRWMEDRWVQYKSTGSSGTHLYYVDGSPKVSDVWFYSSPTDNTKSVDEWRTVLICGLRKGGSTYFALDITDTENPLYLWEFPSDLPTLAKMGGSWSDPAIGRVRIEVSGELVERWVAFIGGGYMTNPTSLRGRRVFALDIKTGAIIKELSGFSAPIAAPITVVDTNNDGYVDRFYVGDQAGKMYVGYVGDKNPTNWTKNELMAAPSDELGPHPIFYPPAVAFDKKGVPWVFFGTGDRENPTANHVDRFYAVKDDGLGDYPRTISHLKDVTSNPSTFSPVTTEKGWTIKLSDKEKVLSKPAVFNRLVYFTTYSPDEPDSDPCTTGGTAKLYVAEFLSGGGALNIVDLLGLSGDTTARSKVIGSGVPSSPVITINAQGKATIHIGTTEGQVFSDAAFSPTTNKEILYWREVLP